ncbi:hypothetical protein ACF0H5_010888 [Mactra antiquata]
MEDSTSSINLLSMKTYPLENNNLLETNTYKLDYDMTEKMEEAENPVVFKKKGRLRFVIAWGVVVFAVLLLIALIVLFIKFTGNFSKFDWKKLPVFHHNFHKDYVKMS